MVTETHGPDPCRGNLRCQDFHDSLGRQSSVLGGTYNCCCCDPCRFISAEMGDNEYDPRYYCCKCVPRGFLLTFTPHDPGDGCCDSFAAPMFVTAGPGGSYYHEYDATLFNIATNVKIGRVIGSGDATDKTCGWAITTTVNPGGSGTSDFQELTIDHADVNCLYAPSGSINLATVGGPAGCSGTLSLEDLSKARLPFQYRSEVQDYALPKFVDLAGSGTPCGFCDEVPRVLCATGYRHADDDYSWVEFYWFDDNPGVPSGVRGWRYEDLINHYGGYVETLYLTSTASGCVITPDLEPGGELFGPEIIGSGEQCACALKETFRYTNGSITRPFTIRSGFCSCWDFVCGTCRCVPYELCITMFDGINFYSNLIAEWNPATYSWDVNSVASSVSGVPYLSLQLSNDAYDRCIISAVFEGSGVTTSTPQQFDCGGETVGDHTFTKQNDILTFSIDEDRTIANSGGDITVPFWIKGGSLDLSCGHIFPCSEATPCGENCGSHPDSLTVNIHQWATEDDISGTGNAVDGSIDVEVYFWQYPQYEAGDVTIRCGYSGMADLFPYCSGCFVYVELDNSQVRVYSRPSTCTPAFSRTLGLSTETCNPYYATTGEYYPDEAVNGACIQAPGSVRLEITVTE